MKLPKDLTKALQPYLTKGWVITEGRRHYKAIAPNGAIVSISHTSSCPFYLKHVLADMKRVERSVNV